jgi:hypothetical protein
MGRAEAVETPTPLTGLYGWTAAAAAAGALAAAALGPAPAAPLSLLAGAVAVLAPFAIWHWLLGRRRPAWQLMLVGPAQLVLLAILFVRLGRIPAIRPGPFAAGMILAAAAAFAFGVQTALSWLREDRRRSRPA